MRHTALAALIAAPLAPWACCGQPLPPSAPSPAAQPVPSARSGGPTNTKFVAKTISAGDHHTCAVKNDGTIRCWGGNEGGQLGNVTTTNSLVPVTVLGIMHGITVAAGYGHSCALLSGGTVQCWGQNTWGGLGNGTTGTCMNSPYTLDVSCSAKPVTALGITHAVTVAASFGYSCAVLGGGTIQCWGRNEDGQLGDGSATDRSVPVTVSGITNAIDVAAGHEHTCAILSDGTVQCWGSNGNGQLGDGTTTNRSVPVTVPNITDAIVVAAGGQHTCAVLKGGAVQCWGYGQQGQLGSGTTNFAGPSYGSPTPVPVSGITNAVAVAAGLMFSCAILSDGTVQCWGSNGNGQLGDGTTTNRSVPVTLPNITNAIAVAAGDEHTCAVLSGGTVQCWGSNVYTPNYVPIGTGQLGNGSTTNSSVPVTVTGFVF